MSKAEALRMIDDYKNTLIDPIQMLAWTHLRVIILSLSEDAWTEALERATGILSR